VTIKKSGGGVRIYCPKMKEADSTTYERFVDYQLCSTIRGLKLSLNQLKVSSLQDEYKHSRNQN
jgi:hypothetical protein